MTTVFVGSDKIDAEQLSHIAGNYLCMLSGENIDDACIDVASRLFNDETTELAAFVTQRRIDVAMLPYFFVGFGFNVAVAALNLTPREALREIGKMLESLRAAMRDTLDDAKRCDLTADLQPIGAS